MDLKQIEYIVKIAEENNITRAAEKLFITQSALNQQLLKIEKELGIQLFYRSRTNWHPTQAGEIYLKAAREMLNLKRETYTRISDLAERQQSTLTVGLTPGRGIQMFSEVYPEFHKSHYYVNVIPLERNVKEQQALISSGNMDIGFQTFDSSFRPMNTCELINTEEFYLAIPRFHPYAKKAAPEGEPFTVANLYELREEPFVLMYRDSTAYPLINTIFKAAGFEPQVLFETRNFNTIVTMISSGTCCGILPYSYIRDRLDTLACFALPSHPTWDINVSYRRGSYLSRAAKDFIQLARNYWSEH